MIILWNNFNPQIFSHIYDLFSQKDISILSFWIPVLTSSAFVRSEYTSCPYDLLIYTYIHIHVLRTLLNMKGYARPKPTLVPQCTDTSSGGLCPLSWWQKTVFCVRVKNRGPSERLTRHLMTCQSNCRQSLIAQLWRTDRQTDKRTEIINHVQGEP
jgi:hypothetical protein